MAVHELSRISCSKTPDHSQRAGPSRVSKVRSPLKPMLHLDSLFSTATRGHVRRGEIRIEENLNNIRVELKSPKPRTLADWM